jgi:hypothetical protein
VARHPASPLLAFWLRREDASPGDVVTQKRGVANFGIRAPAYAIPLSVDHADRNQIFLRGQRLGARLSSQGLHRTSQPVQAIVKLCTYIWLLGSQTYDVLVVRSINLQNGNSSGEKHDGGIGEAMAEAGCSWSS